MNTVKISLSFFMAALLGVTAGACQDSEVRADRVCKRHCAYLEDCNDTDYDNCINTCNEAFDECDSDADAEMALDKLSECRQQECSDALGCETDAWIECKL